MMKKKLCFLMMAVFFLGMTACSDDDDDKKEAVAGNYTGTITVTDEAGTPITIVCWTTPAVVSFTGERRAICSSVPARLTMKKKTGIWQKKSGISKVKKYSAEERQPRLFQGNFNSPCRSVWISPIKSSPHSPIWKEST